RRPRAGRRVGQRPREVVPYPAREYEKRRGSSKTSRGSPLPRAGSNYLGVSRTPSRAGLLAGAAVDRLAQQVGVPGMTGVLLDEVLEDVAHRRGGAVERDDARHVGVG